MVQSQQPIALLVPLLVGIFMTLCTLLCHSAAGTTIARLLQRRFLRGSVGRRQIQDMPILFAILTMLLTAHLVEMALWAAAFVILGEFNAFATAFYHSCVNYTTLGYGDIIMAPRWRLLGPLEAVDGMLMFGISTALFFAIVQRFVQWHLRPAGGGRTWLDSESRPFAYADPEK
ncbi:MAG TPA: potassium channel family protein [Candidatus Binataceae bacterium]|nr:potassium channel family protein [Candidatus Binataceae bacterium]